MSVILYNIFLRLYRVGANLKALFNVKARKWVAGRKQLFERLEKTIPENEKIIWFHCASLGEFEQGRPVMEALKKQYQAYKLLLTFFSPSGYEVQKNYQQADWIFYLPMDGSGNARHFLEIVQPKLVIFVKYEFWYYYLQTIWQGNIPLLLISTNLTKNSVFFKWYGGLYRKMLQYFTHIFLQTKKAGDHLASLDSTIPFTIAGDTRYDRVVQIASSVQPNRYIENFLEGKRAIICGSTWPEDEKMILTVFKKIKNKNLKFIIAPHEINALHFNNLQNLFPESILYSELGEKTSSKSASVLIIDNIGLLSSLYRYAYVAYVGGGLKPAGVHNILEAAVFNKPVLLGPYHKKYNEAVDLVNSGGGIVVSDASSMERKLEEFLTKQDIYTKASQAAGDLVHAKTGAAKIIVDYIQEKRLLTN